MYINLITIDLCPGQGGGVDPSGTLDITSNGMYNVYSYASASVSVHPSTSLSETYTSNGSYSISGEFNGGLITIEVPSHQFITETLSVSENGTYIPSVGVDGFSEVVVDVPQSVTGYTLDEVIEGNFESISFLESPVSTFKTVGCWGNITGVSMPNIESVPKYAFMSCDQLTTASFNSCTFIDSFAFQDCYNLTSVTIHNIINVGYGAFVNCTSLSSINMPNCELIQGTAFQNVSFTTLSLSKCKQIDGQAFMGCYSLNYVSLPVCSKLGYGTFMYCSELSTIYLPMCGQFEYNAFTGCTSLTQLTIATDTYERPSYNDCLTDTPFVNEGTGSIYVGADKYDWFVSADGWSSLSSLFISVGDPSVNLLSITSEGLLYGDTTFVNENCGQKIGAAQDSVTAVSLPNCVNVNNYAFFYNNNMSTAYLPVCEYVGQQAFYYCTSLTSIELPACSYLDFQAFGACESLSYISLPICSYIGQLCFIGIDIPKTLILGYSGVCENNHTDFGYSDSFYVPASLVDAYKSSPMWSSWSAQIFPIE